MAEQSLRNKRGGANPYVALYEAWAGAAEFVLAPRRRRGQPPVPGEILTTDDVAGIDDVPLRHQMGLMLSHNRSLKAQLDIPKDVRNVQSYGSRVPRTAGSRYVNRFRWPITGRLRRPRSRG